MIAESPDGVAVRRPSSLPTHAAQPPVPPKPEAHAATPMAHDEIVPAPVAAALGGLGSGRLDLRDLQTKGLLPQGHLEPDATYHAGPNGSYEFKTDSFGRLKSAEATLEPATGGSSKRTTEERQFQREAAQRGERRTTWRNDAGSYDGQHDVGFHLLPARNGTEAAPHTLVPGNADLNVSDWKRLENLWNKHLDAGREVHVKIDIAHGDLSNRPSSFATTTTVDGRPFQRRYANESRVVGDDGKKIVGSTMLKDAEGSSRGAEAGLEMAAKVAKGLDRVGKVAGPLALVGDAIDIHSGFEQDHGHIGRHTIDAAASAAGGWAGALAGGELGGELGATIGSVVPGAGTIVGGVVGGVVGGAIGGVVGSGAGVAIAHGVEDVGSHVAEAAKSAWHSVSSWF